MAKSHQHGALGKARKKRLRATIGLLRDRLVAPRTLARHRASTAAFFNFCSMAGYPKPHLPKWISAFVNSSSTHGKKVIPATSLQMRARASNALRGHLSGSQRLLRAWSKNELPERADPLQIIFLLAMVGAALTAQKLRVAVTFDRFPRSLENHRNHLHPSTTLHLSATVWTCTTRFFDMLTWYS